MRLLVIVFLFFLAGLVPAVIPCEGLALEDQSPISINISEINTRIEKASAEGAQWPTEPLQMTIKLFGETPRVFLPMSEVDLICHENEKLVSVVIMRGIFTGQTGKKDWCEFHYRQAGDGTWRICYILPLTTQLAQTRDPKSPLKAKRKVHRVE